MKKRKGKFARHKSQADARKPRSFIEPLERRVLLSAALNNIPLGITPIVLPTMNQTMTSDGLELNQQPIPGQNTPNYIVLDAHPQVDQTGIVTPFSTTGPTGFTPSQIRHAYGLDQVMYGGVIGDGSNQTIAIIDAYDYPTASTDLHNFDLAFGLPDPPSLTRVNETGGATLPGTDPSGKGNDWEVEEALDVEWAHAMAPGASILLVEATNPSDVDLIQNAVGYARSVSGVVAITMSFGRSENSSDASLDPTFTTPVGHNGVTFLASTGDSGAPGEFPAMSPNVVAVGGTSLHLDGSGNYLSETAWSGSGGGISSYETQPAFQHGVVTQSTTQRTIPDVSLVADPATGVSIYDTYDYGTVAPWTVVGGTSVASPCWAGIIAVADQGRTLAGVTSMDGPTKTLPRLYAISSSDFHDIISGSNGNPAGVGYDLVTGRGSPVANILVPQLSAAGPYVIATSPTASQVTPLSSLSFTFSGAMDPSSFSIGSDVDSFTDPNGQNLLSSINGFSWLNGNTTLQVNFAPQSVDGFYHMVIGPQILAAGGQPMDQNQNGVAGEVPADEFTASVGYDANPLQVISTNPTNGSLVSVPFTTLTLTFNEAFDPATVGVSNLSLNQGTVIAAAILNSATIQYTLSGVTGEGPLTVALAAGALKKASDELPMLAYTATYFADIGTRAMPIATSVAPAGSEIYQSSSAGYIGTASDVDNFTIQLNAGQTLTVVIHPTVSTLQPTVSVLGPGNNVLGVATAGAANQDAVVQSLPVTTAGTYTIVISGNASTTGGYSVQVDPNAAVEAEEHNGPSDNTLGTAQNLNTAALTLPGGASIASVLGALATSAIDYYSFTLAAGDATTLALTPTSAATTRQLSIYDAGGNLLTLNAPPTFTGAIHGVWLAGPFGHWQSSVCVRTHTLKRIIFSTISA